MEQKKLRILVVAEEVNYDRTSCGLVNAKIIYSLCRHQEVSVLTEGHIPADFHQFHRGPLFHFRFNKPGWLKLLGKIPMLRKITAVTTGINHNAYHKFLAWKREIPKAMKAAEYDRILLLGTGMGYYAHHAFCSLYHNKGLKMPVIMNIHDPYPMALLPAPYNAPWDRSEKLLAARFAKLIGMSTWCWGTSQRQLEWMYETYPLLQQKGVFVPQLATRLPLDPNLRPAEGDVALMDKINDLHTSTHFLLVHMGSLLEGRTPKFLFNAFTEWLAENPAAAAHAKMVFIGRVHPKLQADFEPIAQHPNFIVSTHGRISYQSALKLQKSATANFIIESVEHASPQLFGKFGDSVLADRPIVCIGPAQSEARRLLSAEYALQATNGETAAIKQVLNTLYTLWQQNPETSLNRPDLQQALHPDRVMDAIRK